MKLQDKIERLRVLRARLAEIQAMEMELRKEVVSELFPDAPAEGTVKSNGISCRFSMRREVDETALAERWSKLNAIVDCDELFRKKHSLNLKHFRSLSDDVRKEVERVIVAKPGAPIIDLGEGA